MKSEGLLTSFEPADFMDMRLKKYEDQMSESEKKRAMVPVWLLKVIEPGNDEAYTVRINASEAPKDTELDQMLFEPVEVDITGLAAKGYIRAGQTSGSIDADSITFKGVSVTPLSKDRIRAFNGERRRLAMERSAQRDVQRKLVEDLTLEIEARLKKDEQDAKASKSNK